MKEKTKANSKILDQSLFTDWLPGLPLPSCVCTVFLSHKGFSRRFDLTSKWSGLDNLVKLVACLQPFWSFNHLRIFAHSDFIVRTSQHSQSPEISLVSTTLSQPAKTTKARPRVIIKSELSFVLWQKKGTTNCSCIQNNSYRWTSRQRLHVLYFIKQ